MFSTYKQVVLQTYLRKKAAGSLSFRLLEPTPAGIKEELTQYLNERFDSKKDEQTLELFFGHHESAAAYAKVLRRVEIDKFRPVIKFLKGKTDNPDDKQVHLAALLIDFKERPYEFGKEYSLGEENDSVTEDKEVPRVETIKGNQEIENEENIESKEVYPEIEETDGKNPVKEPEEMGENEDIKVRSPFFLKTINKKKSVFTLFLVLLFGSLGFVVNRLTDDNITGKQCMYWKGDHYEAIECDIKLAADIDKIALDTFLLKNFKKITRVDTITERSIGKIWYLKHQKSFDFFTAKGVHPIHKRKLSRLSKIIYDNEIKPLKTAE